MDEELYTGTVVNKHLNKPPTVPFIGLGIQESFLTIGTAISTVFALMLFTSLSEVISLIAVSACTVAYVIYIRMQIKKDPRFREAMKARAKRMKPHQRKRDFIA